MGDKFYEWVLKHNIGPGMNDGWRGRQAPPDTYVPNKNYTGFDGTVGDGWIPIIDRLATDLIAMGWDRDLHQVKEKFGTLRFYIGHSNDEMEKRIDVAEDESAKTCEECGAYGTLKGTGWVVTLCDPCYEKYLAERSARLDEYTKNK